MPRKRNETNKQWMERLQAYRADELMERTRAAVCIANAGLSERAKMHGFLALFHPEIEPGTLRHIQIVQDAERK